MTAVPPLADPLTVLPPEIVLRILEFASLSTVAALTATSTAWHYFIDVTHQDAIYCSKCPWKSTPAQPRSPPALSHSDTTYSQNFEATASWKDLCRGQTLLDRNWALTRPVTRESVLQVGNDPVWRFRADLKRRFFISTSHAGGLNVTDMDTGHILWRLPSSLDVADGDAVRPYAHLEYRDGTAVFDREGDAVEVWQADLEGAGRGEFRRLAVLGHDCQTRGFQLSYLTLCVVSTEGQGFVYDMTQQPPRLTTHLDIEHDAIGHLDQNEDAVVYSMGSRGYHVYNKASGALMGTLQPAHCTERYHIDPPDTSSCPASAGIADMALHGPTHRLYPPESPSMSRLVPITIDKGPLPPPINPVHVRHGDDEWGAGMFDGDLFVGFSRAGRIFVCSDWRKALHDTPSLVASSALIECDSDGSGFDLGGWLSVRNHRVMVEIHDRVYIVALDDSNRVQDGEHPARASYSLSTSSAPQLTVPVSYMVLYDDAIMTTYTTLGRRQYLNVQDEGLTRFFPTKMIRVVSLDPDFSNHKALSDSNHDAARERTGSGLWDPGQGPLPADEARPSQVGLLHLLSMLRDEFWEAADDDLEWGDTE